MAGLPDIPASTTKADLRSIITALHEQNEALRGRVDVRRPDREELAEFFEAAVFGFGVQEATAQVSLFAHQVG